MATTKATADRTTTVKRTKQGYTIDGRFYRRVSTFLNGIPKPWIGPWAAKHVAEFAVDQRERWAELPKRDAVKLLKGAPWSRRDAAGDRGSAVHRTIEATLRGEPIPEDLTTEDELDCAIAVEAFVERFVRLSYGTELVVWHPGAGYAGTLDLWCKDHSGRRWLLDWKTSKDVYPEHAVQLAAYAGAQRALVEKAPVESPNGSPRGVAGGRHTPRGEAWTGREIAWGRWRVDALGVVHVTPHGATLYPVMADWDRLWEVFRAAADVKRWQLAVGRQNPEPMFGEPTLSADGA